MNFDHSSKKTILFAAHSGLLVLAATLAVTHLLPGQAICLNWTVTVQIFGTVIRAQSLSQTSGFGMLPSCLPGASLSICGYTKMAISTRRHRSRDQTLVCLNRYDKMTLKVCNWFNGEHPSPNWREFPAHSCRGGMRQPCFSQRQDVLWEY